MLSGKINRQPHLCWGEVGQGSFGALVLQMSSFGALQVVTSPEPAEKATKAEEQVLRSRLFHHCHFHLGVYFGIQ